MKNILASATLATLLLPVAVFAQGGITPVQPLDPNTNIIGLVNKLINYALGVLAVLAVIMIVYAAFLYVFAGTEEKNTDQAKKLIKWALIAIAVGLLAKAVVYTVGLLIGTTLTV